MSTHFRALPLLATALLLAAACLPRFAAGAEEVAPAPAIEIVNEGGLAETYRREGSDFAAYGPDGVARVPTAEAQALQALAAAHDVQFVSLDAAPGGKDPVPCPASDCVGGIAVVGRAKVGSTAQLAIARDTLRGWLKEPGGHWSACMPEYHHALTFSAGGHDWEVLLCYGCGQYLIRRDGVEVAGADAAERPGQAEINALLGAANIRHWDADKAEWRTPAAE